MRVIWSREALENRDAVWTYLADHSVGYADRVERRIKTRGESLAQFPHQGRPVHGTDLRKLSIPDVQYVILYRIEDDAIRILRLWHTAQDQSG